MADDDTSKVLILHPDSESATQVLAGLADEVGEDLNLISVEFSSKLTTQTSTDSSPTITLTRWFYE